MSTNILTPADLPEELLCNILARLSITDLLHAAQVSKTFYQASHVAYHQQRLHTLTKKDLRQETCMSFDQVKQALLSQYGYTLGLWRVDSTVYGGLVHVIYTGYELVAVRYYPPIPGHQWVKQPLRPQKLFTIKINEAGVAECVCYRGQHKPPHVCSVYKIESGWSVSCASIDLHSLISAEVHERISESAYALFRQKPDYEFQLWDITWEKGKPFRDVDPEDLVPHMNELSIIKYEALRNELIITCSSLPALGQREGVAIRPGLFKGMYGLHGTELLMLTYPADDQNLAIFYKVTGDNHVPASKITIQVDVSCSKPTGSNNDVVREHLSSLPSVFCEGLGLEVPEAAIDWFKTKGQVAQSGYKNPQFIQGELYAFNDIMLGHLWKDWNQLNLYARVTESFVIQHWNY